MTEASTTVLVDTDVFSKVFVRRNHQRVREDVVSWKETLKGRYPVIAFQTRAEILAGVRSANWGDKRMSELRDELERIPTVPPDEAVIDSFAALTAQCKATGHALHEKLHTGDRWIAACAVAHDLPVLSGDGIFVGVPGLRTLE